MPPMLTAPDPAVFSEEVRRFAAERGVTDYLVPLYELTRRCFPGAEIAIVQENDYEIAGLAWIVYEALVYDSWDDEPRRAAYHRWIEAFIEICPSDKSINFTLGLR
jgi:hypothetical protein